MTEEQARKDLKARGIWRLAPGLWCDKSVPDMFSVHPARDTAVSVRAALEKANQLPEATP